MSSNHQSIVVSYHTSPSPDVWERIQSDLHRQLPLKNLNWTPTSLPHRSIGSLQVAFQPFNSISSSLSSNPLVHLIFVACDDHEAYKTVIKQEIKDWLDLIQSNLSEWFIVHVSTASRTTNATTGIFRSKIGVLDKLKADFNPPKKERCIQLSYTSTLDAIVQASIQDSVTHWSELISKLKESLLYVLDLKVTEMQDSLRELDSKRTRHGWEFESFFIQKAQLGNQLEIMNLLDDSLIQFDELEAALFQSLLDSPHLWREKVVGKCSFQYSTLDLTSDYSEQYLELVGSGQMSIFDSRIYLFSKQTSLLGRLGKFDEAMKRAIVFVATFSAFLRFHKHLWPVHWIHSWTYTACNDLVEWCEQQVPLGGKDLSNISSLRRCAHLLELAHNQLDQLGINVGHLPSIHPFNMSLTTTREEPFEEKSIIHLATLNPTFTKAVRDNIVFEKAYLDFASRVINLYRSTGRRRSALKLHCKIAAFEQVQQRQEPAHRLYSHLPAHYVDDRWTAIESSLLSQCASLQKSLGMSKEWLLSSLALVRSGVTYETGKWSQDVMLRTSQSGDNGAMTNQTELAKTLMQDIKDQAYKLEKEFAAIGYPTFSIKLNNPIGFTPEGLEGSAVQVKITNLLPCSVDVDSVRMKFAGVQYDTLWFTARTCTLRPGENLLDLFCATPVAETLVLDVSQIRISRIIFQYYHRPQGSQPRLHHTGPLETVSFSKDPSSIDIKLELPHEVLLDVSRHCLITFFSGRNYLSKVTINLTTESQLKFDVTNTNVCMGPDVIVTGTNDRIELANVPENEILHIKLPFSISCDISSAQVSIHMDYRIRAEDVKRSLRKTCRLMTTFPFSVDLKKKFRPDEIMLNFLISPDEQRPLRILSAHLEYEDLMISDACKKNASFASLSDKSIVVLPSQSYNYFFNILREDVQAFKDPRLKLVVKYRTLVEEIVSHLEQKLIAGLLEDEMNLIPFLLEQVEELLRDQSYNHSFYSKYIYCQILDFSEILKPEDWNSLVMDMEKDEMKQKKLLDRIQSTLREFSNINHECPAAWRTLIFPFQIQIARPLIIMTINYEIKSKTGKVGIPLSIDLILTNSFNWFKTSVNEVNGLENTAGQPRLEYELLDELSGEEWLIGNCRKGSFFVKEGKIQVINSTLLPLKPGNLSLPKVSIKLMRNSLEDEISRTKDQNKEFGFEIKVNYNNLLETILIEPNLIYSKYLM
ncbi:hypothetical protein O181_006010 [Austropuccinia psidii MF-1]|uniref:Trafficking protein particle complex subunit 11 domain-containing protein n=1 Tax=Austropuccinia psidii MF-1 TaxID=1389203 RepID=A0A9Q3BJI4_9BASI|nr:hypothetical protein [Austropuccinia psidii MF-1]